jgi:hypothetical protein
MQYGHGSGRKAAITNELVAIPWMRQGSDLRVRNSERNPHKESTPEFME